MALHEEAEAEEAAAPSMSPRDQLTYDPTQGRGTSAWELSTRASMEQNADMRRN